MATPRPLKTKYLQPLRSSCARRVGGGAQSKQHQLDLVIQNAVKVRIYADLDEIFVSVLEVFVELLDIWRWIA